LNVSPLVAKHAEVEHRFGKPACRCLTVRAFRLVQPPALVKNEAEVEGAFDTATLCGASVQRLGARQGSVLLQNPPETRRPLTASAFVGTTICGFRRVKVASFL
jgi:hypothetical protein